MDITVKKILVVEDEDKIMNVIKSFLESKGFIVIPAQNGKKALELFNEENIDLMILDLMLPLLSGDEVCKIIRKKSNVPIIMLTAKSDEENMLKGLKIGADDYITKPFSLKTLLARMEAVLRRSSQKTQAYTGRCSYHDGELVIDFQSRCVYAHSEEVKLTPNEFKILSTLAKNPNKVFSRESLIENAFSEEYEGYDRTIDSHIKNLRQKIEVDSKNPIYVKTLHGVGYKFGGQVFGGDYEKKLK